MQTRTAETAQAPAPQGERTIVVASPVGPLRLRSDGEALTTLWFAREPGARPSGAPDAVLRSAAAELDAYFRRALTRFETPTAFNRGSAFRRGVWEALRRIPYGRTCSYADIARQIGQPSAMRAVGAAIGANPIAIIVPCHRVIGAKGALVGFGGGLDAKRRLLELEGVFLPLS
jgi:methylated-DNA-[protein]-cysteine S-methyltransferase